VKEFVEWQGPMQEDDVSGERCYFRKDSNAFPKGDRMLI
jgi:hypothetical protein